MACLREYRRWPRAGWRRRTTNSWTATRPATTRPSRSWSRAIRRPSTTWRTECWRTMPTRPTWRRRRSCRPSSIIGPSSASPAFGPGSIRSVSTNAVTRCALAPGWRMRTWKGWRFRPQDTFTLVARAELRERLGQAIRTLPARQREALVLRVYHDHAFAEIGVIMSCSEGTAKANYHHAVDKLRRVLMAGEG